MCPKKVKIKNIKAKKVKVRKVKSRLLIEFEKLMRENLESIKNEPKIDFSGIRRVDDI